MPDIEFISFSDQILAVILRREYEKEGIEFFTPGNFSQQLGYMKHKKGYCIQEHVHVLHHRDVNFTQETLLIKNGRVRVNFFNPDMSFFTSRELKTGDVILLASGGHGFEFLEDTEIIEVKQGPYWSDKDKVRFRGRTS